LDDVNAALGHAVGEFLNGDRLRDHHITRDLFLGLGIAMAGHALYTPAERGNRALAYLVGGQCRHEGEAPAPLFCAAAGRFWDWRRRRTARRTTAAWARRFILIDFGHDAAHIDGRARRRRRGRRCGRLGLGVTEALLGFLFGALLGFLVVAAPLVLV